MFSWQYFGTAILPYYFYTELNRHFNPSEASDPSIPFLQAKALLPAAAIAFLHPYRMVYFQPSSLTVSQQQSFIAIYQLGPFICYALVAAFVNFLSSDHKDETIHAANADVPWIKGTYAAFGLFSGVTHLSVLRVVMLSKDPSVSLASIFVPRIAKIWRADAVESLFVEESLFFLQWDFILVVLAGSIYVTRISEVTVGLGDGESWLGFRSALMVFSYGIACVMLGPGAVISAVLYLREDFLRKQYAEKVERDSVHGEGIMHGKP